MAGFSPKWALNIYAKLWVSFRDKNFSKKEAEKVVKDNKLSQVFSILRKDGWLEIELDPKDARKSLYLLHDPKKIIERIGKKR